MSMLIEDAEAKAVREQTQRLVEILEREHPEQECEPEGLRLPEPSADAIKVNRDNAEHRRRAKAEAMRREADQKAAASMIKKERVRTIILSVAERHAVLVSDLLSASRCRPTVEARQAAYMDLRSAGIRVSEIGRIMGKDHSTVLHGLRRAASS